MPTDAVILVESLKKDGNIPEYLIFVRGDKFESSWSLAKALEEFCGKNTAGFEMSYYAGISPKEFETRFTDKFSRVNVLFAISPEDLNILKKRFGVLDIQNPSEEILESDYIKPRVPFTAPLGSTHDNIHFNTDGNNGNYTREMYISNFWINLSLIIFIFLGIIVGIIYFFVYPIIKGMRWALNRLFKQLKGKEIKCV